MMLPSGIGGGGGMAGPVVISGIAFSAANYMLYRYVGSKGALYFFVGSMIIALVMWGYHALIKKGVRRKGAKFDKDLQGQTAAAAPVGISRAEQIAKLDQLRKRFAEGVEKFRRAGRDMYALPWFVVVGEPGSGKTEAIRHSSIGFPAGLQDELQGVGGTINMNWWFTNDAVLLDLAGRLMFEEVQAGRTSEWNEFLALLAKHRKECPINGLILVIPADSLIKDSQETIQGKAARIAQQLENIKRALNIRFPVFVVVTKADLINGFREFFDDMNSPDEQQQILGWSNPRSIDEPFDPAKTDEWLRGVVRHIERRRLHLLEDPTPQQDLSDSRFNEVDTLFDLPRSFERIIPPLASYLRRIFVTSEWADRPLFMRGIYFTSSLREGSALDADLASVLGLEPEALPEGRIWEREKSFFLRDVFLHRIFKESRLVTRAANVNRQHMRRKIAVLASGAAGLLLLLFFTWFGASSLKRSIGQERDLWNYAADQIKSDGGAASLALVSKAAGEEGAGYRGGQATSVRGVNLAGLHSTLHRAVQTPIHIPWIFRLTRPFGSNIDSQRRTACRALFELGVLQPLAGSARRRMDTGEEKDWAETDRPALEWLIAVDAGEPLTEPDYGQGVAGAGRSDLWPLIACVVGSGAEAEKAKADAENLQRQMAWCYQPKGGGGTWPPAWLIGPDRLNQNRPLLRGLNRFIYFCTHSGEVRQLEDHLKWLQGVWARLPTFPNEYREAEGRYRKYTAAHFRELEVLGGFRDLETPWTGEYALLQAAMKKILGDFEAMEAVRRDIAFLKDGADARTAYRQRVQEVLAAVEKQLKTLLLPADKQKSVSADMPRGAVNLVDDVCQRESEELRRLRANFEDPALIADIERFARVYLEMASAMAEFQKRFGAIAPILLPREIRPDDSSWPALHIWIEAADQATLNAGVKAFCADLGPRLQNFRAAMPELLESTVATIMRRAAKGADLSEKQTFGIRCTQALREWKGLKPDALNARARILSMTNTDFVAAFVAAPSTVQEDFASMYWEDIAATGLRTIAVDAAAKVKELLPTLMRYARFPLDVPRQSARELSRQEMEECGAYIRILQPVGTDAPALGGRQETGLPRLDQQIRRMRELELGAIARWLAGSRAIIDALTGVQGGLVCSVNVAPRAAQQTLLTAFGNRTLSDDSVLEVYRVVLLRGEGHRRVKTDVAEETWTGSIVAPGPQADFEFFVYVEDDKPVQATTVGGDWSSLRLVRDQKNKAQQVRSDPRSWYVEITVNDPKGRTRSLWLLLRFNKTLPGLSEWPVSPFEEEKP